MIQRPQSITMALSAILLTASIFTPIWQKATEKGVLTIGSISYGIAEASGAHSGGWTLIAAILAFVSICLSFVSIFAYKSRMRQLKINLVNIVVILGVLGANYFFYFRLQGIFEPEVKGTFGLGFFLPLIALLMMNVSNHLIRRDEKLVRDADRLR
jgi:uncharacterized membrane protein